MSSLTESIKNSGALDIQNRLQSMSGGRILDVGTQHGSFISTLMKSMRDYEEFVGIDILEENLEKARESFSDGPVKFELMNAEELSFDDESFDTVSISFSLHHLENVRAVLGEMVRVLKPEGHLIIQEMFSDDDQSD
ncbi:MAG: class I SAM-dependent methyltransferase, partial [Candidatus Thorarchaeota archaeon]